MIFVTVGTHEYNFNRLVQAADELVKIANEEVVIQKGSSTFNPRLATSFDWATPKEMEELIDRSRIVIAHAGAGTIISTFRRGKNLVLAPRLAIYHEVFNDHQLQLASVMEKRGFAVVVLELSGQSLFNAVQEALGQIRPSFDSDGLKAAIREKLSTWQATIEIRGEGN